MDTTTFHTIALQMLQHLADCLENECDALEIDLIGSILTIIEEDSGKQWILNTHEPTQQIWLASPHSGAWHFAYNGQEWLCTRTQKELEETLLEEFSL